EHAIRLAYLDSLPRVRQIDPAFQQIEKADVDDLVAMFAIVPFEQLTHGQTMLLNPVFKETARLVGGADADLISGTMLIDFKVTMRDHIPAEVFDQLIGYFILARRERQLDPTFPRIDQLGIYFCRHGWLLTFPTSEWTGRPEFEATEE